MSHHQGRTADRSAYREQVRRSRRYHTPGVSRTGHRGEMDVEVRSADVLLDEIGASDRERELVDRLARRLAGGEKLSVAAKLEDELEGLSDDEARSARLLRAVMKRTVVLRRAG